jgi:hypothetical protein
MNYESGYIGTVLSFVVCVKTQLSPPWEGRVDRDGLFTSQRGTGERVGREGCDAGCPDLVFLEVCGFSRPVLGSRRPANDAALR